MLLQHIHPAIGALPTAEGKAISYIKSNKISLGLQNIDSNNSPLTVNEQKKADSYLRKC